MAFLVSLVVEGALTGTVYALIGMAFVLVYRATRMINFALGEWVGLGGLLVAFGGGLGLGAAGAILLACLGLTGLALGFNRLVLDRLAGRQLIALIMATLGLSLVLRGGMGVLFGDTPRALPVSVPTGSIDLLGFAVERARLIIGVSTAVLMSAIAWFLARSRAGLALRALADDPQAAMAAGIDTGWHCGLAWVLAGLISVAAGIAWTLLAGGGLGLQLIGLKVFPVVVIGGLDSIGGALLAALVVGIVESLAAGYLGPVLGYGVGGIVACVLLLAVLMIRPHGLLGRVRVERV